VPRLCGFYPGICLTTEEKSRKNLSQGKENLSQFKKNLRVQCTYYQKQLHITKPTQTHTLQPPPTHTHTHKHTHTHTPTHTHTHTHKHTHTHTYTHTQTHTHTHKHTHTLQNNTKPPQYKLKQTQYKIYPNETITI
jgi:hypothetical protein